MDRVTCPDCCSCLAVSQTVLQPFGRFGLRAVVRRCADREACEGRRQAARLRTFATACAIDFQRRSATARLGDRGLFWFGTDEAPK